jgi:hypothetical protein
LSNVQQVPDRNRDDGCAMFTPRLEPASDERAFYFSSPNLLVWRLSITGTNPQEGPMARYGKAASESVRAAMRRKKRGTLRSGKGGKGGIVKSRKQAIAIGLSEARKRGAKVPREKSK